MTGAHRGPVASSATYAPPGGHCNGTALTNGITPDQVYKLGVEALGWDNSTAESKALIAKDMKLLKRLGLLMALASSADHHHRQTASAMVAS